MNRIVKAAYAALVFAFLYLPLVVIAVYSFNASKYSLAWKGFTLQWYGKLIGNATLLDAALRSMTIAVVSATVALALGTLAAFMLHQYRFKGRKAVFGGLFVMMMSPDIVIGISLLVLFLGAGLALGFWTLLMGHVTLCMPFAAATVYSRFEGFDPTVVEAARDLGATEYQVFRRIVLPMAAPGLVAAWLLSFTLSLDDVIVSFFTTGPTYEVLPLRIYSMVRLGIKPDVNALSVVMIAITVTAVVLSRRLLKEKS
ncbi:MAG: spermidine/putrescine ABC transporter permease PotC [Pseudodesulfovibrio sp.]|jgi:spermidine/putrescine transport system permease protein|uniref:Spermidine/putrescine transport system permease protein PotC n=1 Tax=Pseudodesulfovibrio indicus TaxID=1716143 RepID=A0A126QRH9_9BACT|nr:spermidine/putrescine ABC transporter permease PotC [Pseudodesulfovibrio indicus]AMK12574.1 spermidine/putrescine ABC transporter permease [Pseudodesulfovibrio indicus]TDT90884.1 spermidine/putrescine transport system permease protein [Pseudodesulfovibrio indicus]